MADLSAVLRKTIDALPAATPQLRAKVYEKARAAVQRQIAQANPPLALEMADARQRALEDAIHATEAYYTGAAAPAGPGSRPAEQEMRPVPAAAPPARPAAAPVAREPEARGNPSYDAGGPSPSEPARRRPEPGFEPASRSVRAAESDLPPMGRVAPGVNDPGDRSEPAESRIGEVGPMSELPAADASAGSTDDGEPRLAVIPEADMTAPSYARPRRASGSRRSLYTGVAALLFICGLAAAAYFYLDEITQTVGGQTQVAETAEPDASAGGGEQAAAGDPAVAPGEAEPAAPAPDPSARQFTQRLLPDGSEVDEGPAPSAPNAFDEGTDIATASVLPGEAATPPAPASEPAVPAAAEVVVPEGGQRAMFYEERSADRPGSQQNGSVVWSVVSEPPAAGQPAEPAIRAVASVPETAVRMTMTIRRNADETLPASHVIELLFDTPDDFVGGEIENVQRLALKPTEEDRGEPLIGVAGRISDGFFIIALNDLQQAVDNNLALMANEDWIDIPMAYASGQRALMSLEKGPTGDEVFREALDAWAARG